MSILDPIPWFYGDVDPDLAAAVAASIEPHSMKALKDVLGPVGWSECAFKGRRGYTRCTLDVAVPIEAQDGMIAGGGWVVRTVEASHSPFWSKPKELAEVVDGMVLKFSSA